MNFRTGTGRQYKNRELNPMQHICRKHRRLGFDEYHEQCRGPNFVGFLWVRARVIAGRILRHAVDYA